ncbi:hypothetical protein ACWEGQ_18995 [Streptomyces seoulensis]
MASDGWYLTADLDDFLARAGQFLHSRPVQHTAPLTVTENLRTAGVGLHGDRPPEFGVLREGGGPGVRVVFFRAPPHPLMLTALTAGDTEDLADRLAGAGHELPGVNADRDTAAAFAAAWQCRTGSTAQEVEFQYRDESRLQAGARRRTTTMARRLPVLVRQSLRMAWQVGRGATAGLLAC